MLTLASAGTSSNKIGKLFRKNYTVNFADEKNGSIW